MDFYHSMVNFFKKNEFIFTEFADVFNFDYICNEQQR